MLATAAQRTTESPQRATYGCVRRCYDLACRTYYQARRRTGDRHVDAQRNLFNKLVGKLYHCLQTNRRYDSATAFPHHYLPDGRLTIKLVRCLHQSQAVQPL
jgi:hypothetical protein